MKLGLTCLEGRYAICRAPADASAPANLLDRALASPGLVSVTRTDAELSAVLPEAHASGWERAERGWTAFRVAGPLDFALTGVLAELAAVLAEAEVSLFAVSTYDTDYVLVRAEAADAAAEAWRRAGHDV